MNILLQLFSFVGLIFMREMIFTMDALKLCFVGLGLGSWRRADEGGRATLCVVKKWEAEAKDKQQ